MSKQVDTRMYPVDFWNFLFRNHFSHVCQEPIELRHDYIRNVQNPWNKNQYDLIIDFEKEYCTYSTTERDYEKSILDFIVEIKEYSDGAAKEFVIYHHDIWKKEQELEDEKAF